MFSNTARTYCRERQNYTLENDLQFQNGKINVSEYLGRCYYCALPILSLSMVVPTALPLKGRTEYSSFETQSCQFVPLLLCFYVFWVNTQEIL